MTLSNENIRFFACNSNPGLSQKVAHELKLGIGKAEVETFSDGEVNIEIMENVRGRNVYVMQSICHPSGQNLMELLLMGDAMMRSAAQSITAVIPYFGYSRQDRRPRTARVPISAKVVAKMVEAAGFNRVITVDLHADQILGFFNIPTDNIYGAPVLLSSVWRSTPENLMVISPDVGGVARARAMAKTLEVDLAIIDKRRPRQNEAKVMHIIGDVSGKNCLLVDDIVDTANTLCQAASALKIAGAKKVIACATHPVLSDNAVDRINHSDLDELLVTNSIPLAEKFISKPSKIRQACIAGLLAATIDAVENSDSVSSLFID